MDFSNQSKLSPLPQAVRSIHLTLSCVAQLVRGKGAGSVYKDFEAKNAEYGCSQSDRS